MRTATRSGLRGLGAVFCTTIVALAVWSAAARAEAQLKDPEFEARRSAFRKAVKIQEPPKKAEALVQAVEELARTRDVRVFRELFKSIRRVLKSIATTQEELDKVTDKLNQVYAVYFGWVEDEYRRTGQMPTTILVIHKDAIETYTKQQRAAAAELDRRVRLRDAVEAGLATNLDVMGEARDQVWKEAVKLGTGGKLEEQAAFCSALGALGGTDAVAILLDMEAKAKDIALKTAALDALARCGAGFDRLVQHLDSVHEVVGVTAIRGVARFRRPETIPALVKALDTATGRNYGEICESLFAITGKHNADVPAAWQSWWSRDGEAFLVRWSDDETVRSRQIEKIAFADPKLIDVAAELAALLPTEPSSDLRLEILQNIAIHRSYYARMTLMRALRDDERDIRLAAIRGLAHYRHLSVPQALMDLVDKADEDEVQAIFQALRKLWGGDAEFSVDRADKEALHRWWGLNKDRVPDQFIKLGARAIAAGKPERTEEETAWQGRDFYGIAVRSTRVLFVVDVSLSMEEPQKQGDQGGKKKIDVAKEELARVIKGMADGGTFGIIAFSGLSEIYETGMLEITKTTRKKALKWIEALETRAATNIYDAMEVAFRLGTKESPVRSKGVPDTIYLVSDGQPTVGKFVENKVILEHIARWNKQRQIKIYAIGVGHEHDVEFLQTLAESHGGIYVAR